MYQVQHKIYSNTAQFPPDGLSTAPADLRAKSRRKASVALRSASLRLGVRHGICVAKMLDNTQSIICAFGLAAAAPRSPYRHLELCGIALRHRRTILALLACVPLTGYILRQRDRQGGPFVIGAAMERYRKTPTPPTGFSCPLGVFTQVVLGVVFRQSTTASKPLKRRPAIIGRTCAGLNCRVNARKSPTL